MSSRRTRDRARSSIGERTPSPRARGDSSRAKELVLLVPIRNGSDTRSGLLCWARAAIVLASGFTRRRSSGWRRRDECLRWRCTRPASPARVIAWSPIRSPGRTPAGGRKQLCEIHPWNALLADSGSDGDDKSGAVMPMRVCDCRAGLDRIARIARSEFCAAGGALLDRMCSDRRTDG